MMKGPNRMLDDDSMKFTVRERKTDENMSYFYRSCFETAKNTDAIQYTSLKNEHPEMNEEEIFQLFRKEIDDSFDFEREDCKIYFIESGKGRTSGYVWVALRDSEDAWDLDRPLWIFDINVHSDFRRKGLGRLLLRKTEEFAEQMRRNIGLFVHEQNSAAINLYKSEGYVTKTIPLSVVLDKEDCMSEVPSDFIMKQTSIDDDDLLWSLGIDSFRRLVRFSGDVSDEEVSRKYNEYLHKYDGERNNHAKYAVMTVDGAVIAFLWVGVAYFSDKYGLLYDCAIDESYRIEEVENLIVSAFKKWSCERGLERAYILYHVKSDINREAFTRMGFTIPGFFLEKQIS
jgi:ribosomal protein S18 acetylase RimI-like enzyme